MSYTVPTASEFKARHTGFASVADGTVTAMLAEASRSVSTCWAEGDYADAIMYLAAHLIAEETSAGGTSAASKAGPIKRVKADTVEIEYMGGNVSDASLGLTIYGRRFLALRHRNAPRALVV
jgi:hypothetical protein